MRLLLVSPPFGEKGQRSKGLPIAPPVLEYLAGLTMKAAPDVEVTLHDANLHELAPEELDADLVGFTVLTPQAPWVYRKADELRALGKRVILGGIHLSALPDEAAEHADSIVVGEVEEIWGRVLLDAEEGRLQPRYDGGHPDLIGLPDPVTTLLPDHYPFGSFFTARGCPFDCTFCSVHSVYGRRMRTRPIDEVVAEVASSRRHLFWGFDDNVWGTDISRSIDLYREMASGIGLKYWFGSADLATLDHPRSDELLEWARRAGLRAVLVGWESENPLTLKRLRAMAKQGRKRSEGIRKIRSHGIDVMLFIVLGARGEGPEEFGRILELADRLDVSIHPTLLTPFPGSRLYEEYSEWLTADGEWDLFDGNTAVFEHDHPDMTKEFRERSLLDLRAEAFTFRRIISRIRRISIKGFPQSHIMSWMIQYPQGRAFRELRDSRS